MNAPIYEVTFPMVDTGEGEPCRASRTARLGCNMPLPGPLLSQGVSENFSNPGFLFRCHIMILLFV